MSDICIRRIYPYPPTKVWHAVTDPDHVSRWTSTGRGGRPEGFSATVGTRFRFVAKPVPGWGGIVECQVLEAHQPSRLRYSWVGDEDGPMTQVTYHLEPHPGGTSFMYEHTGFTGLGGFLMAKLVLGPVRKKMLDVGLPAVLRDIEEDGNLCPEATFKPTSRDT
jgi:uncharacterized protein YndB with AHSA1/START domain